MQLEGYSIKKNLELEDYDVSLSEGLSATADQTWLENPTSAISRLIELNQATATYEPGVYGDYKPEKAFLNWQTKEQADKAAKKDGLDLKFSDDGISKEKLDILIERKREEVKRKSIMGRAPQGFVAGTAKIGASLAVSAADPLNIASAFVPVVSQKNAVRLLSRFGKTGGRATVGAIEGVAGAAMIEPLVYYAMTEEQSDYTLYDSYMNLTFGAVIGGGLHAGLGAIGDRINRSPAQSKSDLLQAATGQALDNRPIDVTRVADEAGVDYQSQLTTANSQISTSPTRYGEQTVYTSANGKLSAIREGDSMVIGTVKVNEGARGLGEGVGLYSDLIKDAKSKGLSAIKSDNIVMPGAVRVWESLERRGVQVTKNPDARFIDDDTGGFWTVDDEDVSVFTADIREGASQPQPKQTHSNEADPLISSEYQEKLNLKPPETPEAIDKEIDDIMTSLDEQGFDTAEVRAEIDQSNKQLEREANGLREAVACMLG